MSDVERRGGDPVRLALDLPTPRKGCVTVCLVTVDDQGQARYGLLPVSRELYMEKPGAVMDMLLAVERRG